MGEEGERYADSRSALGRAERGIDVGRTRSCE